MQNTLWDGKMLQKVSDILSENSKVAEEFDKCLTLLGQVDGLCTRILASMVKLAMWHSRFASDIGISF